MMVIIMVMIIRVVSVSVSVVVISLFFITEYGMTESSNSMNCVMSNSSYSSDGVVNKSEDEIVSSLAIFSLENVLDHLFSQNFSEIFLFFISKYGMTKSSNSTDCVMSNSSYSSNPM